MKLKFKKIIFENYEVKRGKKFQMLKKVSCQKIFKKGTLVPFLIFLFIN